MICPLEAPPSLPTSKTRKLYLLFPSFPGFQQEGGGGRGSFLDSSCQGIKNGRTRPTKTYLALVIHGHLLHVGVSCRRPVDAVKGRLQMNPARLKRDVSGSGHSRRCSGHHSWELTPGLGEERVLGVRSTGNGSELPLAEVGRRHLCFL